MNTTMRISAAAPPATDPAMITTELSSVLLMLPVSISEVAAVGVSEVEVVAVSVVAVSMVAVSVVAVSVVAVSVVAVSVVARVQSDFYQDPPL